MKGTQFDWEKRRDSAYDSRRGHEGGITTNQYEGYFGIKNDR